MNINLIAVGLLFAVFAGYLYKGWQKRDVPVSELPWVPIDVRKSRSFVNQTRDAGMFVEKTRRCAVLNVGKNNKSSTNGYLEAYMITGACGVRPRQTETVCPFDPEIEDGGAAVDEICNILDGGGNEVIDLGNARQNVCDV